MATEYTPKITVNDAWQMLNDGVETLRSSEEWVKYLDFQSSFHTYSFANVMLIMRQFPKASMVAGYNQWKKHDRHVKYGSSGIRIFVPRFVKVDDQDTGEKKEVFLNRYLIGSVFDISQTEGKPVPMRPVSRLVGDDYGLINKITDILNRNGWTVDYTDELPVGATGIAYIAKKAIDIDATLSPAQTAKTLLHEWAHAYLHTDVTATRENYIRGELEAESVAYIVGRIHGLDTSDFSFGYLANWADAQESFAEQIRESGKRIQEAAKRFMELLDPQTLTMGGYSEPTEMAA